MAQQARRPGCWWYLLAALIPLIGLGIFIALVFGGVTRAQSALEGQVRVTMPGTEVVELPAGRQTIYVEYTSSVEQDRAAELRASGFTCTIRSETTEAELPLQAGISSRYSFNSQRGESLWSVDVPEAGGYRIACDGDVPSRVTLLIGSVPIGQLIGLTFGSVAICIITPLLGGGIALTVFLLRLRAAQRQAAQSAQW